MRVGWANPHLFGALPNDMGVLLPIASLFLRFNCQNPCCAVGDATPVRRRANETV